jgi:hypothetical protein
MVCSVCPSLTAVNWGRIWKVAGMDGDQKIGDAKKG